MPLPYTDNSGEYLLDYICVNPIDNINSYYQGACQVVPAIYPIGTTVNGNQAQGYEGNFSCWSDVYTEHGVRVSPGGGAGRVYFDYGPVENGSVDVTFQWVDNAWWSDLKALEVYNWSAGNWEQVATWEGCDGQEHVDTYSIPVNAARIGPSEQVRISLWGGASSVIHLSTITVN